MDFLYDPWTRFMHNIHTTAPYFYGWTAISLIPYVFGLNKFLLTWLLFRLWSVLGLIASFFFVWQIMKKQGKKDFSDFVLLMFNPLLFIELVSNSHNDGWMMWPALASLWFILPNNKLRFSNVFASILLLLFSLSTKYVTVVLIPVWLFLLFQSVTKTNVFKLKDVLFASIEAYVFDISALLLFLPLLSSRSQLFNPWYLSWSIMFFPLLKSSFLKKCLLIFSVTGLLRYIPWMYAGAFEYTSEIIWQQKVILWSPVIFFAIWYISYNKILRPLTHRH
jgi:hypothetical protein